VRSLTHNGVARRKAERAVAGFVTGTKTCGQVRQIVRAGFQKRTRAGLLVGVRPRLAKAAIQAAFGVSPLVAAARARAAGWWPIHAAAGNGPLHARADEYRCIVDAGAAALAAVRAARTAAAAAAGVDLIAVVLVVRYPVDPIERLVVATKSVIVVVPEVLQPEFLARLALVVLAPAIEVPARLVAAIATAAEKRVGGAAGQEKTEGSGQYQSVPFHP